MTNNAWAALVIASHDRQHAEHRARRYRIGLHAARAARPWRSPVGWRAAWQARRWERRRVAARCVS
jgi:hypothetical protein